MKQSTLAVTALLLVIANLSYALKCYQCSNKKWDAVCNTRTKNCSADNNEVRCKGVTKLNGFIDKGCATESSCEATALRSGEVLLECCSEDLCNVEAPVVSERLALLRELEESLGMLPDQFMSQITLYQMLSAVIYLVAIAYIIKNIPRNKTKSIPLSSNKVETEELTEIVE